MQAITRAIEAQDRLVEEAKTGIVETALGTNECAPLLLFDSKKECHYCLQVNFTFSLIF